MPNRFLDTPGATVNLRPPVGNRFLDGGEATTVMAPVAAAPPEDSGFDTGTLAKVGLGAAGLAGVAALTHSSPGMIGKAARGLNALRQQLMLSGFALPKSMLGNAGAALTASVERGTLAPLKEMFSSQTVKDAVAAYRNHASAGPTPGVNLPGPMPGRIMGAFDDAAQKALQRAGLSAEEATNEVLQTPLGKNYGPFGDIMESPVASYMHPFRRTPFNQFAEGYKAMTRPLPAGMAKHATGDKGARRALAMYGAAGAVHGAATSDDNVPMTIPLAISLAGRYGLPYGMAALVARYAVGGKQDNTIAGSVLPVSEYGFNQSLSDPLKPFKKPAAFSALEKLTGQ